MAAPPPVAGPPKLTNLYYLRTVGTARACQFCNKETVACLSNADVTDFIYCCTSHLSDPGFARPAPTSPSGTPTLSGAPAVPQEEIDKVKKEYEERQARKKEAAAEKEKEAEKEKNKDKSWLSTGVSTLASTATSLASAATSLVIQPTPPTTPPPPAGPPPTVFILHRSIFAMRTDAAKKKWQAKEAKERLKTLSFPSVPGSLPARKA